MLRISKLTDYGTVVLAYLADLDDDQAAPLTLRRAQGLRLPLSANYSKRLAKPKL